MRTVALNSSDVNLSAAPADVWFGADGSETPVRAGKPDREIDAFVAARSLRRHVAAGRCSV